MNHIMMMSSLTYRMTPSDIDLHARFQAIGSVVSYYENKHLTDSELYATQIVKSVINEIYI